VAGRSLDFGFRVNDRFVSVTPQFDAGTAIIVTTSFSTTVAAQNQVRVRTFNAAGSALDSAFFLVVY
jgi:hypothetical protein